jgi:hypothetical protein
VISDEVIAGVFLPPTEPEPDGRRARQIGEQDGEVERSERRAVYALNELPQPQPPVEFGFLKTNPEPCMDDV